MDVMRAAVSCALTRRCAEAITRDACSERPRESWCFTFIIPDVRGMEGLISVLRFRHRSIVVSLCVPYGDTGRVR